jgi:hypothetical protein
VESICLSIVGLLTTVVAGVLTYLITNYIKQSGKITVNVTNLKLIYKGFGPSSKHPTKPGDYLITFIVCRYIS